MCTVDNYYKLILQMAFNNNALRFEGNVFYTIIMLQWEHWQNI